MLVISRSTPLMVRARRSAETLRRASVELINRDRDVPGVRARSCDLLRRACLGRSTAPVPVPALFQSTLDEMYPTLAKRRLGRGP